MPLVSIAWCSCVTTMSSYFEHLIPILNKLVASITIMSLIVVVAILVIIEFTCSIVLILLLKLRLLLMRWPCTQSSGLYLWKVLIIALMMIGEVILQYHLAIFHVKKMKIYMGGIALSLIIARGFFQFESFRTHWLLIE